MDTYYTIEEKYLQAVEELNYGETPKSLHLLNDIIQADPLYARAHYQLGLIYYYDMQRLPNGRLSSETVRRVGATRFPDVYIPYLQLLVFLNKESQVACRKSKQLYRCLE
jgi:hypothetical protein